MQTRLPDRRPASSNLPSSKVSEPIQAAAVAAHSRSPGLSVVGLHPRRRPSRVAGRGRGDTTALHSDRDVSVIQQRFDAGQNRSVFREIVCSLIRETHVYRRSTSFRHSHMNAVYADGYERQGRRPFLT